MSDSAGSHLEQLMSAAKGVLMLFFADGGRQASESGSDSPGGPVPSILSATS